MLRLTHESLCAIPGYVLSTTTFLSAHPSHEQQPLSRSPASSLSTSSNGSSPTTSIDEPPLKTLHDFLATLDRALSACLRCQAWNHVQRVGLDVELEIDVQQQAEAGDMVTEDGLPGLSSLSGTDRVRLRSILLEGMNALEDWLEAEASFQDRQPFACVFEQTLGILAGERS